MRALAASAVVALIVAGSLPASAQQGGAAVNGSQPAPIDDTIEAGEAEAKDPVRRLVSWNEYEGRLFTIRVGGGFLYEYADYAQDENSKAQVDLAAEAKVRDTRLFLKGRLKSFKRAVTWSAGLMYDGPTDEWLVRETGLMIEVPEISGHLFVGRSKEGFSLNKIMVGYAGWTQERATINDATIPILADGIKWLGYAPKIHLLWNVGAYADWLSEGQGFSTYDNQFVGRVAWLPFLSTDGERLLHLGVDVRYGHPNEGTLKLRSRPESFPSPYFVDTGDFAAKSTRMTSLEAYSRPRLSADWFRVLLSEGGRARIGRSVLPRGRNRGDVATHGRDPYLQHAWRILQSGVAGASGVPGRAGRLGARRARLVYRSRQRLTERRPFLASHADGQLVPVRPRPPRDDLRLWCARSIRSRGQDSLLSDPPSIAAVRPPDRLAAFVVGFCRSGCAAHLGDIVETPSLGDEVELDLGQSF